MAHIRTWDELQALGPTEAEEKLIAACQAGEECRLGDGELPPKGQPTPDREIRAEVLRYLILGGCDGCVVDNIGVWLTGGQITGLLDLDFTAAKGAIRLDNCHFDTRLDMEQACCAALSLIGSELKGLRAQAVEVKGTVFLRELISTAMIDMNAATIGGQVQADQAKFQVGERFALNLQGADVGGSVSLNGIEASATINLMGAAIGGQLSAFDVEIEGVSDLALDMQGCRVAQECGFHGFTADGGVSVQGAVFSGQIAFFGMSLRTSGAFALDGQSMIAQNGMIWRDMNVVSGMVSLNSAYARVLADDTDCWPEEGQLLLDGFVYDRISGGPTDAKTRLPWLKKGAYLNGEFYPQPYTQLAKVLRDMGHDSDARTILQERDRLLGPPNRKRLIEGASNPLFKLWYTFTHPFRWFLDILFRYVAGYGHRPFRSIVVLVLLIIATIIPAHFAWEEGSFAPNSAVILNSESWKEIANVEANPAKVWSGDMSPNQSLLNDPDWRAQAPGRDWESFNAVAYGFDIVIPIINFGQTEAWAPSTTRGRVGWHLWWARWVLSAAGWIVTALGAAAITGLIRRE